MNAKKSSRAEGRISVHPRGFGFLNLGEGADPESAFIAPPDLNPFLEGDRVRANVVAEGDGRYSARDLELVERSRSELFGRVVHHRGRPHLEVDPKVSNTSWPLAGDPPKLRDGQQVVAEVEGEKVVFKRRVDPDEAGLERVLVRWEIRHHTPQNLLDTAAKSRPAKARRRDLRDLATVTLDSATTRDLDDALAVLPPQRDGAVRVLVSIADVDAFAPAGSDLDIEARRRATSVYLPDRVIPMFPEALSTGKASLVEGEERPALTVELRIDPEGQVTAADIYQSWIKNHARLTYPAVAEFLDHNRREAVPERVHETLRLLRTAAARLSSVRSARGGLTILDDEVKLEFHEKSGEPVAVNPRRSLVSNRLIELLMVAANEAVARYLDDRGLPGIYRVHPEPDEEQVESLARLVRNFGFEAGFGRRLTPRALSAFENQFRSSEVAPSIDTVLTEVLGPARYSAEPATHFGLGSPVYLHFTSPIRRYADLTVHRVIKAHLAGRRDFETVDPEHVELCEHLNRRSYHAAKAENERLHMLIARLFSRRIGEKYKGDVVAVKNFGLVVQLEGEGVTGTIVTEDLPGGPYHHEQASHSLVSKKRTFTIGDEVRVEIVATDEELGRLEFELA